MLYLTALITMVGALIVAGCSDDDEEEFRANLTGAQEVPPVTTAATGTLTLDIDEDQTRIDYRLELVPPFSSNVRVAHIHVGPAGVNGPVILFLCTNDTPPAGVPAPQACPTAGGTITGTLTAADLIPAAAQGVNTFADAVTQIVNGNTYGNAHTDMFRSGEVRGQISKQ
jgi:hypothetical protein